MGSERPGRRTGPNRNDHSQFSDSRESCRHCSVLVDRAMVQIEAAERTGDENVVRAWRQVLAWLGR